MFLKYYKNACHETLFDKVLASRNTKEIYRSFYLENFEELPEQIILDAFLDAGYVTNSFLQIPRRFFE